MGPCSQNGIKASEATQRTRTGKQVQRSQAGPEDDSFDRSERVVNK